MAPDESFARPAFRGGRFDAGAGMPVDALPELTAYAEIITDLAKALFKQRHPDRQRVSPRFAERLQLRVSVVEPGSQVPVLVRSAPPGELALSDEYEDARDLLSDAIASAANEQPLPDEFPPAVLAMFSKLGQRLRPDEHIVFARRDGSPAIYDRRVRSRLVKLSGRSYSERQTLIGFVSDLNSHNGRFELRLRDGSALSGEYASHWESLHTAQGSPPESGRRARVDAEVEVDSSGQPQRIAIIHEVAVLDTWEWASERLGELQTIDAGWIDGSSGEPLQAAAIAQVDEILQALSITEHRPPHLFPTPEGGITMEWRSERWTINVEVGAAGDGSIHVIDVEAGTDTFDEWRTEEQGIATRIVSALGEVGA